MDGFDVIAMSVAATALSNEWGITRAQLGPIFSAALVGMAVGAALLAPLADKFGRRKALLCATFSIGVAMVLTGMIPGGLPTMKIGPWEFSRSIFYLILIRFTAGLGVGIIFANAASIASEAVPEQHRDYAVLIAIMGYPFGAMLVGPLANAIIASNGWEMVFIYAGFAAIIMGGIIFTLLPESINFLAEKPDRFDKDLTKINTILARFKREPIDQFPPRQEQDSLKR